MSKIGRKPISLGDVQVKFRTILLRTRVRRHLERMSCQILSKQRYKINF